jgi:hypothetical protein
MGSWTQSYKVSFQKDLIHQHCVALILYATKGSIIKPFFRVLDEWGKNDVQEIYLTNI